MTCRWWRRRLGLVSAGLLLAVVASCGGGPGSRANVPSAGGSPTGGPVATAAGGLVFTDGEKLMIIDPESKAGLREILNRRGKGTVIDPAWSPDRTQIAYSYTPVPTNSGNFGSDIYVVAPNGNNPHAIFTHDVDGGLARAPVWAPDGASIYFSYSFTVTKPGQKTAQTTQRVERMEIKTGARTVIANDADLPTLSADGARLAFVRFAPDSADPAALWVSNSDGSEAHQLVPGTTFQMLWGPRFSPDGKQIIFAAAGGDRSKPRLTVRAPRVVGSAWPPSVSAHGFPMDFWLVDVASAKPELLVALGADDPWAAWAPDGKRLAYLSVEGLFLLDLSSGSLTTLSQTAGFGALDWAR